MNLSQSGNGAANLKEISMRQAFGFLTYYAMRRTLGAVAKLLDRMDRRERERRAQLRAHWEDVREGQHPSQRSQEAQDGPGTPETTTDTHPTQF